MSVYDTEKPHTFKLPQASTFCNKMQPNTVYLIEPFDARLKKENRGKLFYCQEVNDEGVTGKGVCWWPDIPNAEEPSGSLVGGYLTTIIPHDMVMFDLTSHLRQKHSAILIARTWKARHNACVAIQRAWRSWKERKEEVWNPHCFVGVVKLYIDFLRTAKE
jgi:hypothetical protein